MCLDISECHDRGYCIQGECLCDAAWFGDTCADNLKTFLPNGFTTFKVIFLMTYSLIGILSFFKIYLRVKNETHMFGRNNFIFIFKALRSPYNLVMMSILAIAITRIFWLAIDPFSYNDIFHRSVERLFFEATYSLLFLIYAIVLWVWYSIYDELSQKNIKRAGVRLKCFRTKVQLFVITVVCAQIITSVLKGFRRADYRLATMTIYAILFCILVIVTIEYIVYGWFLYKCITDREETINDKYEKLTAALPQTGQVAAAYGKRGTAQSILHMSSLDKRYEERDRSSFNDSEKNEMMQAQQQPDSPSLNDSRPRLDILGRYTSDSIKKVAFKQAASHHQVIIEGMEELEDDNSLEIEPNMPRGPRIQSTPPAFKDNNNTFNPNKSLTTFFSLKKSPDMSNLSKKGSSAVENELLFDKQVRDIVKRHEKFLKPVEVVEVDYENIDDSASVIIDDNEDVMWDFVDEEEIKKQEDQVKEKELRKEEIKQAVAQMRMKAIVIKYMTAVKKNLSETYQLKLLDDPTYLKNHRDITKNDKIIVKKILSLTVVAISLEVLFGVFTILIFYSPVLQSPIGMIFAMWMTGFLEVFGISALFMLFSIVQTQEKENLRLIMRIGQNNRINRMYGFVLPKFLRQEESKRSLEKSINQMTAKYIKSWTKIHG